MIATNEQIRYTILLLAKSCANRTQSVIQKHLSGQPLSAAEQAEIAEFQTNQQMYSNLLRKYV
jgi:hypothetical protein